MAFRPMLPPTSVPVFARARTRPTPPSTDDADSETPPSGEPRPTEPAKRRHHKTDRTGPNWDDNGDYLVGKDRPPKERQWVKGQSGNPKGPKPRAKPDPQQELNDAILAPFTTIVNGQPVQTTVGVYAINILKAKAAQKDRLAATELLNRYEAAVRARHHSADNDDDELSPEQREMIEALLDTAGWDPIGPVRKGVGSHLIEGSGDE